MLSCIIIKLGVVKLLQCRVTPEISALRHRERDDVIHAAGRPDDVKWGRETSQCVMWWCCCANIQLITAADARYMRLAQRVQHPTAFLKAQRHVRSSPGSCVIPRSPSHLDRRSWTDTESTDTASMRTAERGEILDVWRVWRIHGSGRWPAPLSRVLRGFPSSLSSPRLGGVDPVFPHLLKSDHWHNSGGC